MRSRGRGSWFVFGVEAVYWLTAAQPMNTKPTEKPSWNADLIISYSCFNENLYQFPFLYVLLLSKGTIWHSKLDKILIDLMGFSRRRWLEPRVDGQVALAAGWPPGPNGGHSSGHTRSSRQLGLGQCLHAPVQWHRTHLETVHVGGQCWGKCVYFGTNLPDNPEGPYFVKMTGCLILILLA